MHLKEWTEIIIRAYGSDERDAVVQLKAFIESGFSYDDIYYCCCVKGYFARKDYVATIENCRKAIKLNANNVYAHYILGQAHKNLEEYETAIKAYTEVIKRDRNHFEAYYNRGVSYLRQEQYDEALEDFKQIINLNSNHTKAHYYCSVIYLHLEQYDKAIEYFERTIKIDKSFDAVYYNRGVVCLNLRRYNEAIKYFGRAKYCGGGNYKCVKFYIDEARHILSRILRRPDLAEERWAEKWK